MIYQFGDCIFDPDRGELRRLGVLVHCEPKVLAVLHYLLQQRQRVVSRAELLEQCWPETYVSDAALTMCLRRVREAIGQTPGGSPLIQTVHRRGYRLVVEVHEALEQATPAALPPPSPAPAAPSPAPFEPEGSPVVLDTRAAPQLFRSDVPSATIAPAAPESANPAAALPSPPSPPAATPAPTALTERRHLTVLSCTLADADTLLSPLDPEDHYELLQRFRTTCAEIVASYAGHVAQQLDAGILVYFGYPQAQEDAALRAVRSGLALREAVQRDTLAWSGGPLAVRVGIASGMMIVRSGGALDAPPSLGVGRASTLAVRLGAVAPPGTVVISAATAQLVAGYFVCKVLEDVGLPGVPEPPLVYEVRGESVLQTRLEVGAAHGLTPFVGRAAEVALLQEAWTYVQEGLGQVVWVQGEAGLGKSRLVQVWKEQLGDELPLVWECRCSPYHHNTAFYPLIELLQRAVHGPSVTSPAERLARLESLLRPCALPLEETVPLLADLVSLSLPAGRYAPLNLTPIRQRVRTLETLVALFLMQAAASPGLFIVEDVHWADPSTVEFCTLLLEHVTSVSLLVLLTSRPEFAAPWGQRSVLTPVVLNRLTRAQTADMITQVAGGKPLPDEVVQQLVEKTDGVPLFVEELTRMVLESGQLVEREGHYTLRGALSALTVPATLHDSLMARLDRLGMGKAVAQWGAVLGREFSDAVLAAVVPLASETVQDGLRQLVEAELVYQRGILPQVHYRFKHALIQDAAYNSLLTRQRQAMHAQVAEVLERQFAELVEAQPEMLAHHYTEARLHAPAVAYWQRAGERAQQRSAYQETLAHLNKGLHLLLTLPQTPARDRRELALQLALGYPLELVKGQGSLEMQQAYSRAYELCARVGDTSQHILALRGLHGWHLSRGELHTARGFAEQAFTLAQQESGAAFLPLTHMSLGVTLYYLGEFAAARLHSEQGYTLHPAPPGPLSDDRNLSVCPVYEALSLWMLGYADQAFHKSQAHIARARTWDDTFRQVFACTFMAQLHQFRRDMGMVQMLAEAALALCQQEWFPLYGAYATMLLGWVQAKQQVAAGCNRLHEGLTAYRTLGSKVSMPYWLSLSAELYSRQGHPVEAFQVLREAIDLAEQEAAGHWWKAELYRLKGELLQSAECGGQSAEDTPEACFQQALAVARDQQAKALELRAAISLARLWQSQDRRQDAYELLTPVYGWFTEGFDTADLQEARTLLTEF
jgi:class 3 adenylate cyclase/DNA-binding winged helix-turn-helix (wHTH) protein